MDLTKIQSQLIWIIPATLVVLAVFQFIYWFFLNRSANRGQQRASAPVMPTMPDPVAASIPITRTGENPYVEGLAGRNFRGSMIVMEGLPGVNEIRFPERSFGIGRFYNPDEQTLIALDDRSISRRHAFFTTENNEYYLLDMSSSYGTALLIHNSYEDLAPGHKERVYNDDIVRFGKTIKVRLRLPGGTRAESTQL